MTKSKEKFTEKGGADMTQVVMNKLRAYAARRAKGEV